MVGETGRSGVRRRLLAALAPMLVAGALVPGAAQAGTVGVTGTIKGAGSMTSVEGGPYSCSKTNNYNDGAESSCTRSAFESLVEAWVWLKPEPADFPSGDSEWRFSHWEGCNQTRPKTGGLTECAVHSGVTTLDERYPKAIFYDARNPSIGIDTGPSNGSRTTSKGATFTFSSDDTLATFRCKLDGAAYAGCTSGKTYSGLSEGSHTFRVYAVDPSGNATPTDAIRTWTVDSIAPSVSITGGHASGAVTNNRNAQFTLTSSEPSQFWCKFEELTPGPKSTAAFSACSGTGVTTGASPMYSNLIDGAYSFSVYANDGLQNGPTLTRSWTVDTIAPDTTLSSPPPLLSNSSSAQFAFSSEPGATFECKLDAGAWSATGCTSPRELTGLTEGQHTFLVRARDAAGNVDPSPASHTWTVDTTAPDTTLSTQTPVVTEATSASFTFSSPDDEGATFECKLDAGSWTAAGCTSPKTLSGLSVGEHTFSVRAKDAAGHVDPSPATRSWVVQAPAEQQQHQQQQQQQQQEGNGTPGGQTSGGQEQSRNAPSITSASSLKLRADKKGRFTLKGVSVTCPAGCVVKVVAKSGRTVFGKLTFTGSRKALRVKLTKKARKLLVRKRKATLKVALTVTPASGAPVKKTLRVVLRRR